MDGRVLKSLPQDAKPLVERIESYAGLTIQVREHNALRGAAACQLDEEEAIVFVPIWIGLIRKR
jgi:hypothetical protein